MWRFHGVFLVAYYMIQYPWLTCSFVKFPWRVPCNLNEAGIVPASLLQLFNKLQTILKYHEICTYSIKVILWYYNYHKKLTYLDIVLVMVIITATTSHSFTNLDRVLVMVNITATTSHSLTYLDRVLVMVIITATTSHSLTYLDRVLVMVVITSCNHSNQLLCFHLSEMIWTCI